MRIECVNCHNAINIPDERLPKGKAIAFPCPACKAAIEINLRSRSSQYDTSLSQRKQKDYIKGDALKKKILRTVDNLPPMPQTVLKAREIMANPKSDFKELGELLETDQAIAAKVLKLANSTYYGMSGKVSSIQHASVVLGHKTLGELITMGGVSSLLGKTLDGYGLDAGAMWKHSLGVAFGSRIIAKKRSPALLNDAFTSGLIHDAGKLILDQYIVERWDLFEEFMADGQRTFLQAEKEILEFDHSEIASEVCNSWRIPKHMTIAIKYHHHPSDSHGSELAYIIHMADAIAMMSGIGLGIDGMLYQIDDKAMEFLNFQEDDISSIMDEVQKAVQQISE